LDGNRETLERYLAVTKEFQKTNPDLIADSRVSFKEADYKRAAQFVGERYIIEIKGRLPRYIINNPRSRVPGHFKIVV
jgi:hypothetical protein